MEESKDVGESSENINLGSSIVLSGFKELEPGQMPIIKKIVGHGVKTLSEKTSKFESLSITMKKIHSGHGQYELHGNAIIAGKPVTSEVTNRNLFFALSELLEKIEHQVNLK
tara:strand:+ start:8104 stop:8439 length:336 start_codon:yes stop_codon:yes gene_type:complete